MQKGTLQWDMENLVSLNEHPNSFDAGGPAVSKLVEKHKDGSADMFKLCT